MAGWWDTLKAAIRGKGKGRSSVSQSGLTGSVVLGTEAIKVVSSPRSAGVINGGGWFD